MKARPNKLAIMENMDIIIASFSLIILILCTFFGVIMRYFFNDPFVWLQEVQLWCFTWVVFFGSGAAFRSGAHVVIEVVVDRMPPRVKVIIEFLGYLVVIAVLSFFLINGSKLIMQLFKTGRTTNILDIPFPVIYSAFPIGCMLMIGNYSIIMLSHKFEKK